MSIRIRPAGPADALPIAEIHVATWRAAYQGVLPAEALAGLSVERRQGQWQQWLVPAAPQRVLVAVDRAEIVGFASFGPSRDADAGLWTGELYAMYVRPDRWGSAAGRTLWAEACAALAAGGSRAMSLWVLEQNPRARRFYEREGARADGEVKDEVLLGAPIRELRYRVALSAQAFAQGFAQAFDRLDEDGMARYLDPGVCWAGGAARVDLVLQALRARAAAPPDALDSFSRESTVSAISGDRYRLTVSERLREQGHAHLWRHALALTVPAERGVTNIVPLDLPGEPARLASFLRRVGVYA